MKIMFISLGCDKNLVDTEQMLGILGAKGHTFTDDETEAEVIVINSCCFINSIYETFKVFFTSDWPCEWYNSLT